MIKFFVGVVVTVFFGVLFFWVAGGADWLKGWIYLGLLTVGQMITVIYLWKKNPDVLTARSRFGEGTKTWDKVVMSFFASLFLGVLIVAAADERFGWSSMPLWLSFCGGIAYLVSETGLAWAMAVNPFFEKTVRIQRERGQRVIDQGPYTLVRHPGYLMVIIGFLLAAPLILGSWWALIPAVLAIVCLVIRTVLEDQTLRKELSGYEEYTKKVRYKLLPGIW